MRIERLKPIAVMTVLLFLLGVSVASAADREERLFSKQPGKSPMHQLHVGKRQGQGGGLQHFLKSLGGGMCESDCCWAWADCPGWEVYCSQSECAAWCPDGSYAWYQCDAT